MSASSLFDCRGVTIDAGLASWLTDHVLSECKALEFMFDRATFTDHLTLRGLVIRPELSLGAIFQQGLSIDLCVFRSSVLFAGAKFENEISISHSAFLGILQFNMAEFLRPAHLSYVWSRNLSLLSAKLGAIYARIVARGQVSLSYATLLEPSTLEVNATTLDLSGAKLNRSSTIRMRKGLTFLDECDLKEPILLGPVQGEHRENDVRSIKLLTNLIGGTAPDVADEISNALLTQSADNPENDGYYTRVASLARCDVSNLTIVNGDFRACYFAGAYNLDRVRIVGPVRFARAPNSPRFSHRAVLADEHHLRASRHHDSKHGWWPDECRWGENNPRFGSLPSHPRVVEDAYRNLRKSLEDIKNEPGAADFYYGEMEMRRLSARRWRSTEWWVLTVYWATSGYALRAWRAFAALMLLLIVGTLLFNHGGFAYPQGPQVNQSASSSSYSEAFAYSVTSATSLLHPATERPLSTLGEVDEAVLRLFGPALLALGVLSLRGRIKR